MRLFGVSQTPNKEQNKKGDQIMAKINKYWGLVAVGALTAAAAGAIAALVSRRSVCEEDFEDDFEDLDDFKDDEKKEEKEEN